MMRNCAAIILGLTLTVTTLVGCSANSKSNNTGTVYGEITSINKNTVTIDVGTKKEMKQPDKSTDDSTDKSPENKDNSTNDSSSRPGDMSMLDLTGESQKVALSDDTEIVRQDMGGGQMGTPPSNDGNVPEKQNSDNTAAVPEKPEGDHSESGATPQAEKTSISIDDLSKGDIIQVDYGNNNTVSKITLISPSKGGGMSGEDTGIDTYNSANEYTTDTNIDGKKLSSTGTDENATLTSSDVAVKLNKVTVTRKSSDSTGGDNSSFYGVGAAILGTKGTTTISDSTIHTDAAGGAGVFAYGDGVVNVSDSIISTKQDTSGGIHVAGGGKLYASNLSVTTEGESSAAIRSDRGGGTLVADGGTYTSNGIGSPAIYCTADIAVNDATLTANGSEAICIEGLNSLRLFNSKLTGNMADNNQNDCTWNVILYQSMSGDSQVGNSTFEMDGGNITAKNGGMFYTTNTESTFVLSNVDITYANKNDFFLKCTGNSNKRNWGTAGANGADCNFTAIKQAMKGDIIWDSISKLDFYMTDGSTLSGAITDDESNAGKSGDGYCNLYIDKTSTWTVTGDSTLSKLQTEGTIKDASGNKVTIKDGNGTVYVKGESKYTITVDSYKNRADVSGAGKSTSFHDYEQSK